ncbi:MAG: hypothetical protein HOY71_01140 [Nonomuraea sp.]|nr:hypothetical protein [Nonomuraea sp.]
MIMNTRGVLAGLCVLAGLTSCSTAGNEIPALPFDAYDLTSAERETVDKARFLMLADCMKEFGMTLKASPLLVGQENELADVEKYGYSGPPPTMSPGYTSYSVTDAQAVVMEGKKRSVGGKAVPAGGCFGATEAFLGQGSRELLGGEPARIREEEDLLALADDAGTAAAADPRIKKAEREWSACMKAKGFDYANPSAAMGDPRWAVNAANDHVVKATGSPAEIETATADAACRTETDYTGVRRAALQESQRAVVARNPERFQRLKVINQVQLANARKFLEGGLTVSW